ncbi:MAG TPA: M2 family metallopeptidase [Blastocatellia bacterium]|nr:M2 family metallopeptidase [Blastocatellia bacterium]
MNRSLAIPLVVIVVVIALLVAACNTNTGKAPAPSASSAAAPEQFIADAEKRLNDLNIKLSRAGWVQSNFITEDTEALNADANKEFIAATTELAEAARRFEGQKMSDETARKLKLLKLSLTLPAPSDPKERDELTKIAAAMEADYGKGKYCPEGDKGKCLNLDDLEKILRESRNPDELKKAWLGWHAIAGSHRDQYARFVELSNKGAREMGFKDTGAMWRSNYDMEPDAFAAEMERLWQQVKPLYDALHTYTRRQLIKKYGNKVVPEQGPIPAHLLGNMWSQQWNNIYDLLKPPTGDPGYNLTKILQARKTDAKGMVKYGEGFFTSLGLPVLPDTFWTRSLFVRPQDREVVCHASAWDIDGQKDVRIKMCININEEDFTTIHHELGHNYYQMAYAPQPFLFQNSANDGFHEAIGDTIALSVTPEYLKKLGLIDKVPDASADIGLLLQRALDKVAFLPFGYLVDQWRWKVFSGEVKPADYNRAWWELREKYQGIAPPEPRSEQNFDAWAKYHVAANTPYARYFLAAILQFQFHRALARQAGCKDPLHRCSIYGNREVGSRLEKMLAMGQSRPWPEALKALTGEDRMDATAILDYFAPLRKWLDEQNSR